MTTGVIDRKLEARTAKLEKKIFGLKSQLATLHRKGKPRAVPDYEFRRHDGRPMRLSQAFGKHLDLVVVHNMGTGCPYCTLWAGFTTFRRNGKRIERIARRFFGPGDDFCSAWHFFDLLAGGVKGWFPKFRYAGRRRS